MCDSPGASRWRFWPAGLIAKRLRSAGLSDVKTIVPAGRAGRVGEGVARAVGLAGRAVGDGTVVGEASGAGVAVASMGWSTLVWPGEADAVGEAARTVGVVTGALPPIRCNPTTGPRVGMSATIAIVTTPTTRAVVRG